MHTIYRIDAEVMLFTLGSVVKVELRLIFPRLHNLQVNRVDIRLLPAVLVKVGKFPYDCIPCSGKFSRRIVFAVFTDWSRTAKIKLTNIFQY